MIESGEDMPSGEALRRALFGGRVFLRLPDDTSCALAARATELVRRHVGANSRDAHAELGDEAHFARVGEARRAVFEDAALRTTLLSLAESLGLMRGSLLFEPPKLRAVVPRGHENPRAAPVYYPHRDTWYAVPQCVINVWIPLHDVDADETFEFFPERFDVAVPNDSATFDYDAWRAPEKGLRIGWQDASAGVTASYPTVTGTPDLGLREGFSCAAGSVLVFCGAHVHRTRAHDRDRTRFSIDARLVHLDDLSRGAGAPSVDVACHGDASADYLCGADVHG